MSKEKYSPDERQALLDQEFSDGPEGFGNQVITDDKLHDFMENGRGTSEPDYGSPSEDESVPEASSTRQRLEAKLRRHGGLLKENWPTLAIIGLTVASEFRNKSRHRK